MVLPPCLCDARITLYLLCFPFSVNTRPLTRREKIAMITKLAGVVKLVYTLALGASAARLESSSLSPGTNLYHRTHLYQRYENRDYRQHAFHGKNDRSSR